MCFVSYATGFYTYIYLFYVSCACTSKYWLLFYCSHLHKEMYKRKVFFFVYSAVISWRLVNTVYILLLNYLVCYFYSLQRYRRQTVSWQAGRAASYWQLRLSRLSVVLASGPLQFGWPVGHCSSDDQWAIAVRMTSGPLQFGWPVGHCSLAGRLEVQNYTDVVVRLLN